MNNNNNISTLTESCMTTIHSFDSPFPVNRMKLPNND